MGHGVHPATQAELGEVLVRHRAVPSHILILVCARQEHRSRHAEKERLRLRPGHPLEMQSPGNA